MNRTQYREARRLMRDNGRAALRWMPAHHAQVMRRLEAIRRQVDPLEALAFDRRQMAGLQGRLWLEWRRAAWLEQ